MQNIIKKINIEHYKKYEKISVYLLLRDFKRFEVVADDAEFLLKFYNFPRNRKKWLGSVPNFLETEKKIKNACKAPTRRSVRLFPPLVPNPVP